MTDLKFKVAHLSGDTFMGLAKSKQDWRKFLGADPLYLCVTETGEKATIHAMREVARGSDYEVHNPDGGDIAFFLHRDTAFRNSHGELAIPRNPKPVREGGHGPRFNSWVKFTWEGEDFTHIGCHLVTASPNHATGAGDRTDQQVHQASLMAQLMDDFGSGPNLCLGSGDLNGALPTRHDLQAIFDKHHLTTAAKETGNMEGTHHGNRIDYIWTRDRDRRLVVQDLHVINALSDHDGLVADIVLKR